MSRVNTVSVQFDASAPERIRNVDVHLFCQDTLGLRSSDALGLQLEYGSVRRFFIKLCSAQKCDELVNRHGGQYLFSHHEGSSTSVTVRHAAGLGLRAVRVANLPIELDNKVIEQALRPYGSKRHPAHRKIVRSRQDSNLRSHRETDSSEPPRFESVALTARPRLPLPRRFVPWSRQLSVSPIRRETAPRDALCLKARRRWATRPGW